MLSEPFTLLTTILPLLAYHLESMNSTVTHLGTLAFRATKRGNDLFLAKSILGWMFTDFFKNKKKCSFPTIKVLSDFKFKLSFLEIKEHL